MLTKNCFEKENFTFYLNQLFVTKNLRRHSLHAIIRKKTLFAIRSKKFFEINKKQRFRQSNIRICARFIYKNVICRYKCFKRLIINNDFKNKKLIKTFAQKYRIKRLIVSIFHSQINEIIKRKHISIKNAFSKLTLKDEKK